MNKDIIEIKNKLHTLPLEKQKIGEKMIKAWEDWQNAEVELKCYKAERFLKIKADEEKCKITVEELKNRAESDSKPYAWQAIKKQAEFKKLAILYEILDDKFTACKKESDLLLEELKMCNYISA